MYINTRLSIYAHTDTHALEPVLKLHGDICKTKRRTISREIGDGRPVKSAVRCAHKLARASRCRTRASLRTLVRSHRLRISVM